MARLFLYYRNKRYKMKNTLLVNLYAGPGAGKSTGAAYIFAKLKMAGIDCEYVSESELKEYADEYCEMITSTFNSIPILQKTFGKFSVPPVNTLADFFMMENDIMTKVLGLKEQQWHEEKEWRKVFELKTDNTEIFYHEGKPYVEYFLDKTKLTGITVFCSSSTYDKAQKDADTISRYISERYFDTKVRVEVLEMYQGASR